MKYTNKLTLLFFITLASFTHYFRSQSQSSTQYTSQRILQALDPSTIQVTRIRSPNVQNYCSTTKENLVSSSDYATTQSYFTTLKMYFSTDPSSLVKSAMNQDTASLQSQAQSMGVGLGIYIVPFIIGLFLSLTLWPCLCCCCTCPSCCPSKCCQKQQELLYTKCQLLWPSIFLILVLLLACAASIPGITRASILSNSIQSAQCGISIAMDDILNGNITKSGTSFFTGIGTLNNNLATLSSNINNIITTFTSNLNTRVANMISYAGSARDDTAKVPQGTANTSLNLVYTNPTATQPGNTNSAFIDILGTPSNSSSLVGKLYNITSGLYDTMTTIKANIDTLNTQSGAITSGLNSVSTNVNSFYTMINGADTSLGTAFQTTTPLLNYIKLAIMVFFAVVIGLSVIALLGVITMACFDKVGCRHLMYISCIFMWLLSILGFLISFLLSFMIPLLYFGCSIANTGLSSQTSFMNLTTTLSLPSDYSNYLGTCLTGGSGQILNALGGSMASSITTQMNQITDTMNQATTYSNYDTSTINTPFTTLQNGITGFIDNSNNDLLNDTTAVAYLYSLANKTYYSSCNIPSLIPSNNNGNISLNCSSGTSSNTCNLFANCPTDACINFEPIFKNYKTSSLSTASIKSDIANLNSSCASLQDDLYNLYNNWYVPKYDKLTAVNARVSSVNTNVNNMVNTMTTLKSDFSTVISSLNSLITIIDPNTGLLAGINCLLLGQDLVLMKDTVCVTMFNSLYFIFVTIGTSSFALLFGLCCIVCSGVRHYKQNQKKNGQKILNDRNFNDMK